MFEMFPNLEILDNIDKDGNIVEDEDCSDNDEYFFII